MEEPHKTHQEPAWGWIGVLGKARPRKLKVRTAGLSATHRHLMDKDCASTVAQSEAAAS